MEDKPKYANKQEFTLRTDLNIGLAIFFSLSTESHPQTTIVQIIVPRLPVKGTLSALASQVIFATVLSYFGYHVYQTGFGMLRAVKRVNILKTFLRMMHGSTSRVVSNLLVASSSYGVKTLGTALSDHSVALCGVVCRDHAVHRYQLQSRPCIDD